MKELEIFKTLGLVPNISSIFLEKGKYSIKINATFQINIPFNRKKNPWILDEKILKYLNLTITFCTNSKLHSILNGGNSEWLYANIRESEFIDAVDYVQINKKVQASYLNFEAENDVKGNVILKTGFTEDVVLNTSSVKDLSVFVAVSLDKKELSKRFNLNEGAFSSIKGYCTAETFIENSQYKSKKLSDISIFTDKSKFSLNSLDLSSMANIREEISKKVTRTYVSELNYSIKRDGRVSGFFNVDILALFKDKSRISYFFDKKEFLKSFFASDGSFFPKRITINRINELKEETLLYDGKFMSEIENESCKIQKIYVTRNKKLYISFLDKTSNILKQTYKYKVSMIFQDYSILYLRKILDKVSKLSLDTKKIINLAKPSLFSSVSNSFVPDFYDRLKTESLSIKETILGISSVITQFVNIDSESVTNIINLSNSKSHNLESLEQISEVIGYIQNQIANLAQRTVQASVLDIPISCTFSTIVNKQMHYNFRAEIIPCIEEKGFPEISRSSFLERVSTEINKYLGVSDIANENKVTYFSPLSFANKEQFILQNDVDFSKTDIYNSALIDIYYRDIER